METALEYIEKTHDHKCYVLGEIYKITNIINGKSYIGQTLTHRLNHKRYRPFGYLRRFKSHVSEAQCNNKKNQCSCIANAIRLHGPDNFEVTLLARCETEELDEMEKRYIEHYNTMYPNGYNLAFGGNMKYLAAEKDFEICEERREPRPRNSSRPAETIAKIVASTKKFRQENHEYMEQKYKELKEKRNEKKANALQNVAIEDPLEQYIHRRNAKDVSYAVVIIHDKQVSFYSKYETFEQSQQRALDFLKKVRMNNTSIATHPN